MRLELAAAHAAVDEAVEILRAGHTRWHTRIDKATNDFLTEVDLASETTLKRALAASTPQIGFYGEEGGGSSLESGLVWVADPLDGTINYATGSPLCGVMLGLLEDGVPVLGVIDLPFLGVRVDSGAVVDVGAFADGIIGMGDAFHRGGARLDAFLELTATVHRLDIALQSVTASIIPRLDSGTVVLTLDPAAAYAKLLYERPDVHYVVAHPCHPSIFLRRKTEEEYVDTFGGIAAPQDVLAAYEGGNESKRAQAETVIRAMHAPVIDLHWVTVKQLAQCEPTLVETVACMIGDFLKESLHEAVHTMGIPEPAARSILLGHVQVALANALQGDHPFSAACMIAMDYGRSKIIKDDWKVIFRDDELDKNLQAMLHLKEPITR